MQNYLDDFWGMGPKEAAKIHLRSFCDLCDLLGFRREAAKEHPPGPVTPLPGVMGSFTTMGIQFSIQPARMTRLIKELEEILAQNALSVGRAAKVTGRLSFAGSTMVGRLGRAYLYVLYRFVAEGGHRRRSMSRAPSQQLRHALQWWVVALAGAPQRSVSRWPPRKVWEL